MKKILITALFYLMVFLPEISWAETKNILTDLDHYTNAIVTVTGIRITRAETTSEHAVMTPKGPAIISNRPVAFYEQLGAGVILDEKGTIVTNTHVIYGSSVIKVTLKDGTTFNASVLFISPSYDFSILRINSPDKLPYIDWADSDALALGQDIITIGHSSLLKNTVSGGYVTGKGTSDSLDDTSVELVKLNINHYPGDSGGPVFDREGKFIGLLNAKRLTEDKACFAVPSNKIHSAYFNLADSAEKK